MSNIALTGNASGTGTFTLAAPNSSTDRTLTLPDEAGTLSLVQGITGFQSFALTANTSGDGDITSNITQRSTAGVGSIGAFVSESSGIFTFSSTGYYFILVQANLIGDGDDLFTLETNLSTDSGSTFTTVVRNQNDFSAGGSGAHRGTTFATVLVDITNTSTHQVKFTMSSVTGIARATGNADEVDTSFTFVRIGDT